MFEDAVRKLLDAYDDELYLYVRYLLGCKLATLMQKGDLVLSLEDMTFQTYLEDKQEDEYNENRYSEDVGEEYERLILEYLLDFGPNWLKDHLSAHFYDEYKKVVGEAVSTDFLKEAAFDPLFDRSQELFFNVLDEHMSDLIKLSDYPFDLVTHQEIYKQDLVKREEKAAREQEEIKRREEEEKRMIEDIFGREYRPPIGRMINYVLHVGETNTGKTFHAIERMKEASSGIYLAPLRLLALEIYERLNHDGLPCSLKTGEEEKIVTGAHHMACTVEMLREKDEYEVVVIDEAQMIADKDRGFSWFKAITQANAKEVHIICSFNAKEMILDILGESDVDIHEYVREIPLKVESQLFRLGDTKKGDALVCFSRKKVLETASKLQKRGRQVSLIYGSMPPETRKKQMQRFIRGETTVIVATDAIGMGLNLPIRRIVFLENEKFDGERVRLLRSHEVKQIAGRAGRKGIYNVGKVAFSHSIKQMSDLLEKDDEPLEEFAIAPTTSALNRFGKYSRNLGLFFYLWELFQTPKGIKKASLVEEKRLYEMIEDTMIVAKLPLVELYSFLHLPFSTNEPTLRAQWKETLEAITEGQELPEPELKQSSLEELERSYKAIGLHLLFLYKLERRTEAQYWERIREEMSDSIHERLKAGVEVKQKTCTVCGRTLPRRFAFRICDECYVERL